MAEDKVRLGIIGLGAEGGMYAKFIDGGMIPNMQIGAICDILPEKKAQADALGVPFFTDYKEMIASGVPCGPDPEKHIRALRRFMEAGYDRICIHQIGPEQEPFMDFYAREVLPRVAEPIAVS